MFTHSATKPLDFNMRFGFLVWPTPSRYRKANIRNLILPTT